MTILPSIYYALQPMDHDGIVVGCKRSHYTPGKTGNRKKAVGIGCASHDFLVLQEVAGEAATVILVNNDGEDGGGVPLPHSYLFFKRTHTCDGQTVGLCTRTPALRLNKLEKNILEN